MNCPAAACSCRILQDGQVARDEGGRELLRNGYGGQAKVSKVNGRNLTEKEEPKGYIKRILGILVIYVYFDKLYFFDLV